MNISCPISSETVDERAVRMSAFVVVCLGITAIIGPYPVFFAVLMLDFFIKGFVAMKYSPISWLIRWLLSHLAGLPRKVNAGPKKFAAKIGFICSAAACFLSLLDYDLAFAVVGGILVFFASLEAFFSFCMGCVMYAYWNKYFNSTTD